MALVVCTECGKEFSDKAKACPNCGCPTESMDNVPVSVSNAHPVLTVEQEPPKEKVVQYLRYAKDLEQAIFTYRNAFHQLESRVRTLGHRKNISEPTSVSMADVSPGIGLFFIFFAIALVISCFVGGSLFSNIFAYLTIFPFFVDSGLQIKLLICLGSALVLWCVVFLCKVVMASTEHSQQMSNYQSQLSQDQKRVERERGMIQVLRKQQTDIEKQINTNSRLLDQLYDLNILHPKFRNMVAVITMLEYFEYGRCTTLRGPHGACSFYADEEKHNAIISKLDVVIHKLDDIRQSQQYLYAAIQEANATAYRIYENSQRMIESNRQIVENTALTAYNTTRIRENSDIMTYITACSL